MRWAWVGVALILVVVAMTAAIREVGANAGRGSDAIARYEMARRGVIPGPLSFAGLQQNLIDCMEMADGVYGRLQTEKAAREMAATCRGVAEAATGAYPRYGFAALVLARLAITEQDWPRFNAFLRLSQQASAAEQWISIERLKLYVGEVTHLETETLDARAADIGLLLESPIGIRSIATLYVESERLRALIAAEAEKRPQAVQARFLATLRTILNAAAGGD